MYQFSCFCKACFSPNAFDTMLYFVLYIWSHSRPIKHCLLREGFCLFPAVQDHHDNFCKLRHRGILEVSEVKFFI